MSKSVDRDPRIPGPATKPAAKTAPASDAPDIIDPVLDPGPQPVDMGPEERAPLDRAATPTTPPDPLAADDPWARSTAAPDPFGMEQDIDFWESPDFDEPVVRTASFHDATPEDASHNDSGVLAQGAEMIRRNPVGTGLVLAGLALLAAPRLERETVRRHTRELRDSASARVEGHRRDAQDRLRQLRDRISDGTEGMSDAARERVVAARRRALDVSQRSRSAVQEGARRADGVLRANPLMSGALAVAAGAALGAALPRTAPEDRRLGALSDRLMSEARAVYEEERARIVAGASAAADEVRTMAHEVAQGTRDTVPDGRQAVERSKKMLRESVGRVATAAKTAADRERSAD